jgi:hypothetical protein
MGVEKGVGTLMREPQKANSEVKFESMLMVRREGASWPCKAEADRIVGVKALNLACSRKRQKTNVAKI